MPTLSEAASKQLLAQFGVVVLDERTAPDVEGAVAAAATLGFPVVVKLCGDAIAHKTERGLVRLGLGGEAAVRAAATELLAAARPEDGPVELLIAPMVHGARELIAGLVRDPQFGPCVMFGVGGVLAEALGDVAFRSVPLDAFDADEILDDLATQKLLGPFRGEPAVDRAAVAATLTGLSRLAQERPDVASVDLNPLIVVEGKPVAVDALVELTDGPAPERPAPRARPDDEGFRALFEPRGVIVAGASTHPAKFGFVALHNILTSGYGGRVGATNLEATPVLGVETARTVDELPDGPWDLVFVCTPAGANAELLRACARRGVRAAFLTERGLRRGGGRRRARPTRARRAGRRARHLVGGPERSRRRLDPGAVVRGDRGAVSTRRPDRDREPVRQFRLLVRELGGADGSGCQPGGFRGERGGRLGRRLPRLVCRRPRDRGQLGVRRRRRRRPGALRPARGRCPAQTRRTREGWHDRERPTRWPRVTRAVSRPTIASSTACVARPASPAP